MHWFPLGPHEIRQHAANREMPVWLGASSQRSPSGSYLLEGHRQLPTPLSVTYQLPEGFQAGVEYFKYLLILPQNEPFPFRAAGLGSQQCPVSHWGTTGTADSPPWLTKPLSQTPLRDARGMPMSKDPATPLIAFRRRTDWLQGSAETGQAPRAPRYFCWPEGKAHLRSQAVCQLGSSPQTGISWGPWLKELTTSLKTKTILKSALKCLKIK